MNEGPQQPRKRRVSGMTAVLFGIGVAALGFAIGALLAGRAMDAVVLGCAVTFFASLVPLVDENRRRGQSPACSRGR